MTYKYPRRIVLQTLSINGNVKRKMRVLEVDHIKELLRVNGVGEMALRNQAAIVCAACWGVTASELSLLEVHHVMHPNGRLIKQWELPADVAFNGHARVLFSEHRRLIEILDKYFDWRVERGWGIKTHSRFRGLNPESKLLLNDNAQAFGFSSRGISNESGKQPTGINTLFRKLIANARLDGVTYSAIRKSFMIHLKRAGLSIRNIMAVTGIRDYESVSRIVRADPLTVATAVGGLYEKL